MFIRYQYVRNAVVGLAVLGGLSMCVSAVANNTRGPEPETEVANRPAPASSSPDNGERARNPAPRPSTSGSNSSPQGLLASNDGGIDPTYARIHETAGSRASSKKVKDLFNGDSWKVNLYDDDQDGTWDRAKVDRDRDDTWDEKWNHKDGVWRRDGTGEYWSGERWVSTGQEEVATKSDPDPQSANPRPGSPHGLGPDPASREVHELLTGTRADHKKLKDVNNGQGVKINLYDDDEDGRWDRAKLDRDRDDVWDEKYTVKENTVERKVEETGGVYYWQSGAWVEKP